MRRILITGGSSYLGQHLVPAAAGHYDVHYTYLTNDPLALPRASHLDVLDRQSVLALVDRLRPEAIIHLAGSNRSPEMEAVIQDGTRHIVQAANLSRARLMRNYIQRNIRVGHIIVQRWRQHRRSRDARWEPRLAICQCQRP